MKERVSDMLRALSLAFLNGNISGGNYFFHANLHANCTNFYQSHQINIQWDAQGEWKEEFAKV